MIVTLYEPCQSQVAGGRHLKKTHARPVKKTPMIAILAANGSFKPKKIQKGMINTRRSVTIVMLEVMTWKTGLMHLAVTAAAASQFASIGVH